jgi:transcriptional regulator with XRE-family HTH domain
MDSFNGRLKFLRNSHKLTQEQLADSIGGSERGIQNYEAGRRKPTYDILIVIADYFDVSIDYLVGRTDNPKMNK